MTNEELINASRNCVSVNTDAMTGGSCVKCNYKMNEGCKWKLMLTITDALEAADKGIEELEKELEIWTAKSFEGKIGSMALINFNLRKEIYELKAQFPKEGEWIPEGKNLAYCSNCKNCVLRERTGVMFYCPNCGARMRKGEQE